MSFGFVAALLVKFWRRDRQAKKREIYIVKFLLTSIQSIYIIMASINLTEATMAIIDTLHEAQFVDEFQKIRKDNFSYDGLKTLFQYLDNLSEDCGENIEFDPVSLCCEFSEYNLQEFNEDYDCELSSFDELDETGISHHILQEKRIEIIDFFNDRSITEEKVLVHHG